MTKSRYRGARSVPAAEDRGRVFIEPSARARRDSEARFRSMANATPVLMWTGGPGMARTWFNDSWLAFAGHPLDREVGEGWLERLHRDDAARVTKAYADAFERREPLEIEYRLQRHDGQYRTVLESSRPPAGDGVPFDGYIGTAIDVTAQKAAAAAQGYLGAILESADEAIVSKDLSGIIQWNNAAAERLFGYTSAELVGTSVRRLIPPELQSEEEDILERLSRGERIEQFETVRLAKDGRRLDVALTISPVRDASGTIIGASKIARDVTEQRRASAAQALLAALVSSSEDAILAKDLNGIIQSCNAAAEQVFGYPAAELVGRPVRILIPADRQAEEDDILSRIQRGERVEHFETVRVRKDGRLIDVSLTISPVRDVSSRIIGVSKIVRDITAQKQAAAELEAQQAWFRITLASIGDAVIATDVNGRVVFMNAVAEHLTGWSTDHAQGRDCRDVFRIIDEQRRRPAGDAVSRVLADGRAVAFGGSTTLVSVDGTERPIDESAAPIRNGEGRIIGVVLVFRDISERRRVEIERQTSAAEHERLLDAERAARAEAERASRVKDEFVAMVSHELRTPLNAILGWTQLMTRGRGDATTIERGLDIVAKNTRLQAQLISDLLDVSRIVSGKLQLEVREVDLHQLVADAAATLRHEADVRRIAIHEHLDDATRVIAGDPVRLQQVLWNLLSNAVKFTPDGGRIDVALHSIPGHAEITIADNGAGIRADVLPRVFERFHQADRSITRRFGGLGLGLSIVKHLVELHGGTVHAASAGEGKGATFTITLPTTTATVGVESTPPTADEAHESVSLASMRVLLVEDEPDTREYLRQLLEGHGASVRSAASAHEALTAFRLEPPDILISDIGLPDVDGYDLMQRIRQDRTLRGNRTPAIALTAYARAEDRTRALCAGYQAHLAKPVESRALLASIASVADLRDRD